MQTNVRVMNLQYFSTKGLNKSSNSNLEKCVKMRKKYETKEQLKRTKTVSLKDIKHITERQVKTKSNVENREKR